MSVKVIDVSSYQGDINWVQLRESGIKTAILKIIRKDLNPDKKFEKNWTGCQAAGVHVHGVYNYSYATTVAKAQKDARKVVEILGSRKTKVYLDVEDSCQKGLGKLLISIIDAYASVIQESGLDFGVYTGESFYNSYIKPYADLNYDLWIARYGKNTGQVDERYKPRILGIEGWQFTSKAVVPGVPGKCDMSVWYVNPEESYEPLKDIDKIAKEVLDGKWGNGSDRKDKLLAAGYDPVAVQVLVNQMLKSQTKTVDELAREVIAGKWGSGAARKKKLEAAGYDYKAVQKKVNELLKNS